MKKFSKKLNLNKREIKDLTTEEQVKLEGGTAYTCGACSGGGGSTTNGCGGQTYGLSGCAGCMGSIGSCQSTVSNCFSDTKGTFGCQSTIYGSTCMGC